MSGSKAKSRIALNPNDAGRLCLKKDGRYLSLDEVAALRAYFEANPERKPWCDAKPGEVWLLTTDHLDDRWNPAAFTVVAEREGRIIFIPVRPEYAVTYLGRGATAIKDGRRLWPEDES